MICLLLISVFVQGCMTNVETADRELEICIRKPNFPILVTDASQRDPWPDGVARLQNRIVIPDKKNKEIIDWEKKYVRQADCLVVVKNISKKPLALYEEWNSWGYYNLKFVFAGDSNEYVVTKKPGVWYRNFESCQILEPGESLTIPVAFADHIWSGLEPVRKNARQIKTIRALFEQHNPKETVVTPKVLWQGSISSKCYSARELLPGWGFGIYPKKTGNKILDDDDIELKFD